MTSSTELYRANLARTGCYEGEGPKKKPKSVWAHPCDPAFPSPAVTATFVVCAARYGAIFAVDREKGQLVWSNAVDPETYSSPSIVGDVVYICCARGVLALDLATGRERWAFKQEATWFRTSPAVVDGRVIVGGGDGRVYAVSAADGSLVWRSDTLGDWIDASASIDEGVVVVSTARRGGRGQLHALELATGSVLWSVPQGDPSFASHAIASGLVFSPTGFDNALVARDLKTGQQRWSFDAGANVWSAPAVADGRVFFGNVKGTVFAVDANSGSAVWSFNGKVGGELRGSAVVAGGVLYIGSRKKLFALDTASGALVWSLGVTGTPLNGGLTSSVVPDRGVVYVAGPDQLQAFK